MPGGNSIINWKGHKTLRLVQVGPFVHLTHCHGLQLLASVCSLQSGLCMNSVLTLTSGSAHNLSTYIPSTCDANMLNAPDSFSKTTYLYNVTLSVLTPKVMNKTLRQMLLQENNHQSRIGFFFVFLYHFFPCYKVQALETLSNKC